MYLYCVNNDNIYDNIMIHVYYLYAPDAFIMQHILYHKMLFVNTAAVIYSYWPFDLLGATGQPGSPIQPADLQGNYVQPGGASILWLGHFTKMFVLPISQAWGRHNRIFGYSCTSLPSNSWPFNDVEQMNYIKKFIFSRKKI